MIRKTAAALALAGAFALAFSTDAALARARRW